MSSAGIYVAYTGAHANQERLEVIANNVANVGTAGFRRDTTRFDTVLGARLRFARAESSHLDLAPGTMERTGSRLHAAIQGDGFFVVQGPDGQPMYTRQGDFRLDPSGRLVLPSGLSVLGDGGPLQVPAGSAAGFADDGSLVADGQVLGRLRVVRFESEEGLSKRGQSLIAAGEAAVPEEVERPRIAAGFSETSNVNLAAEMVALIEATRSFEASMRSLSIQDELTQRVIQAQLS